MHILLVADGRSPITRRWVQAVLALHHRVTLISTYPCAGAEGAQATHIIPVAFSEMAGSQAGIKGTPGGSGQNRRKIVSRFRSYFLAGRYLLGPLTLPKSARRFQKLVGEIKPDLVHALRIPFEGMLASHTPGNIPMVVSIWGNDLTYHANGSPMMRKNTLATLQRADGLLADAERDLRLGIQWGFAQNRPAVVVPGGAGIDLGEMHRLRSLSGDSFVDLLPAGIPLVVNPRGFRPGSVRTDTFFQSLPLVLERWPKVFFVCPGMAGQAEAIDWVRRFKLGGNVRLLPFLPQVQLWDLFTRTNILVSVSAHDGTPNSFLEGIACGCFPIVGDIESLREWVTPGVNGFLVEPGNAQSLAEAILNVLNSPGLQASAAGINQGLIQKRAEIGVVRAKIAEFYERILG